MGHRPMYCSDFDGDDCTKYESIVNFLKQTYLQKFIKYHFQIRLGLPITHAYGLEKLFYKYGVDLGLLKIRKFGNIFKFREIKVCQIILRITLSNDFYIPLIKFVLKN